MGLLGCPETSVINYQSTLRNVSEESRSYLHRRKLENQFLYKFLSLFRCVAEHQAIRYVLTVLTVLTLLLAV
jgi:hypothetical protein